jgi:hypothetical protein
MTVLSFPRCCGPSGQRRPLSHITLILTLVTAVFGLYGLYGLYQTFITLNGFLADFPWSGSLGLVVGTCILVFPVWLLERSRYRRTACDRLLSTIISQYLLIAFAMGLLHVSRVFATVAWTDDWQGGIAVGLLLGFTLATVLSLIAQGAILAELLEEWWRFNASVGTTFTPRVLTHCDEIMDRLARGARSTPEGQELLAEDFDRLADLIANGLAVVRGKGSLFRALFGLAEARHISIRVVRLQRLVRDHAVISDRRLARLVRLIRGQFQQGRTTTVPAMIDAFLAGQRTTEKKTRAFLRRLRSCCIAVQMCTVRVAQWLRISHAAITTSRRTTKMARTKLPTLVHRFRAACAIILACILPLIAILTATRKLDGVIVELLSRLHW